MCRLAGRYGSSSSVAESEEGRSARCNVASVSSVAAVLNRHTHTHTRTHAQHDTSTPEAILAAFIELGRSVVNAG